MMMPVESFKILDSGMHVPDDTSDFQVAVWAHLVLPEPPTVNTYWRIMRNRAVKTDEARAYATRVMVAGRNAKVQRTAKPVAVTMHWYRKRKAGDLDNRAKVMLDALQGVAYENDNQVIELHMYRHDDAKNPRMEVVIRECA